jgi:uncharacterized protein (DUF2062 family)
VVTPKSRSKFENFRRLLHFRLVVPVLRAKHPPSYTARSVAVGLLVAMTPTVGAQMVIVLAIWFVVRFIRPAWDFNVVIAMLWTWITNIFTLAPVYYLFLITGRVMQGGSGGHSGYDAFTEQLNRTLDSQTGFIESLWIYIVDLFEIWGLPMFLGSIPWAIMSAGLGYWWSLRVATKRRAKRKPAR